MNNKRKMKKKEAIIRANLADQRRGDFVGCSWFFHESTKLYMWKICQYFKVEEKYASNKLSNKNKSEFIHLLLGFLLRLVFTM
jgi:hypothetical protein